MKKVYLLAVIAAVIFGVLMYLFLQGQTSAKAEQTETKTVVVATCDIAADVTITGDMVKEVQVDSGSAQVNEVSSKDDVIGKCSPAQIVKGEHILKNMVEDASEAGKRLSAQIESGKRGMTIDVDTSAGVGGYVKAGDYIDLMGSVLDEDGNVISVGLIVENVEVMRVNEATKEGQTPYTCITLSMTMDQCEAVYAYQAAIPSGATADYHALLRPATGGAQ